MLDAAQTLIGIITCSAGYWNFLMLPDSLTGICSPTGNQQASVTPPSHFPFLKCQRATKNGYKGQNPGRGGVFLCNYPAWLMYMAFIFIICGSSGPRCRRHFSIMWQRSLTSTGKGYSRRSDKKNWTTSIKTRKHLTGAWTQRSCFVQWWLNLLAATLSNSSSNAPRTQ